MRKINNIVLNGAANHPFALDVFFTENGTQKPVIVFAHGFKGFKDWGHWGAIGEAFAEAGFVFVKFNFSHNGVTIEKPLDFADLEAFGQNNHMKEIVDIGVVMDWLFEQKDIPETEIDRTKITVIGHSRGGPIAILKGLRDERITSVITWASVLNWIIGTMNNSSNNGGKTACGIFSTDAPSSKCRFIFNCTKAP